MTDCSRDFIMWESAKNKKTKFIYRFLSVIIAVSIIAEPLPVFAEIETGEGGSVTLEHDGDTGERSGGKGERSTESGGGPATPTRSQEYYDSINARNGLGSALFNGAIFDAKASPVFDNAVAFGDDIIRIGEGKIDKDRLNLIDELLKQFEENFGKLDGWEKSSADSCNILLDKTLPSALPNMGLGADEMDEISKLFYMSLLGNEKFPDGAGTYDFDKYLEGLDLNKLLKGGGLGGLGFDLGDMQFPSFEEWLKKGGGRRLKLGTQEQYLLYLDILKLLQQKQNEDPSFTFKAGDLHGLRSDLFSGGLDGYSSFIDSIKAFRDVHKEIFDKNSNMDSVNVLYLEDNHIVSVDATEYYNVSFTSDKRLWSVYDERGRLVKQVETENEDHKFIFRGFPEGHYTVIAQQWADYQITKNFYYRKYEYLIDTVTKTMLWARRSGTNMIRLKNLKQSGYRPNGKTFKIHVNKHGEIVNETQVSERIE